MAIEMPVYAKTFEAGEDLSAKQFRFVKFNGTAGATGQPQVVVCTGATDIPCGVLQNKPVVVGEAAHVFIVGESKVDADAALSIGDFIGTSADGQADAKVHGTDTTEYVCGRVTRAAGAAGRYASAFIDCLAPHRAA